MAVMERPAARRFRSRMLVASVAVGGTVAGMLVAASPAQAVGAVHFVNGGTGAPASTLGPYVMTPFAPDNRTEYSTVTSVPGPTGSVEFSPSMAIYEAGDLLGGWGNGYTGATYSPMEGTTAVTLTLPANTGAFYLYALGGACGGPWDVTATTDNGTSSGPISVLTDCSANAANKFGFYADPGSTIASITVSVPAGASFPIVGEFGIAYTPPVTKDPKFTSTDGTTFTAGSSNSFTVATKVDAAHGTASLSDGGCTWPTGVSFTDNGNGTGTLSGAPGADSGGVYACTFTATNSYGSTTQSFTLTVDQAPQLSGPASPSFTVGSSGSYTYKATGYPGVPTIGISSGTLPSGVSLAAPVSSTNAHGDNVTTVNLQGTPDPGSGGVYPVTLVASNGTSPDATITITITVYEAPTITSADHTTFTAQHANTFQVTTAGGYPPGPITFTESGALPPGVTLSSSGLLSGNPPVSASGYWTFTITASNGFASSSQVFTLFVQAPKVKAATMADPGGLNADTVNADHECFTWELTGYAPHAPVTVIGYPAGGPNVPTTIGTFDTNSNGKYTLNACLPDTARGAYTLLAAGYALNGTIHYQKATTIVQP